MNRTHQFENKKLNRNKFRKKKETILNDNDNLAHLSDKIDSLGIDKPKETNNNTLINENNQDSFSSKIVKKAVVSVKKFVDTTKNDEVTVSLNLFFHLIVLIILNLRNYFDQ